MFNKKNNTHPVTLFAQTNIGKERDNNEDSVASLMINSLGSKKEFDCGILVVADGMGGYEKGEIASDVAAKTFVEEALHHIFHASKDKTKINYTEILEKSVAAANREVLKISSDKSTRVGSTLVGAIILDNKVFVVNVGDSRAYLVQPKKPLLQITKDHSVVQEMIDGNMITKEQARNHPRRNIVTKSLGLGIDLKADVFENDFNDGTLLLCSDGLHGMIDDEQIAKTINGNIYNTAEKLIALANENGGMDNISVALASHN
jgi:protein phosphatase